MQGKDLIIKKFKNVSCLPVHKVRMLGSPQSYYQRMIQAPEIKLIRQLHFPEIKPSSKIMIFPEVNLLSKMINL